MTIVVLGVGNILLSDEGVGVRAVEAFQERFDIPEGILVVDGGTSGMDLLDQLMDLDHLIIVDAINGGDGPGSLRKLRGDEVPALFQTRISPHQIGLSEVLAALKLMDSEPKGITLIGVVPARMELSLELSPEVDARLEDVVDMIADELASLGMTATERPS